MLVLVGWIWLGLAIITLIVSEEKIPFWGCLIIANICFIGSLAQ